MTVAGTTLATPVPARSIAARVFSRVFLPSMLALIAGSLWLAHEQHWNVVRVAGAFSTFLFILLTVAEQVFPYHPEWSYSLRRPGIALREMAQDAFWFFIVPMVPYLLIVDRLGDRIEAAAIARNHHGIWPQHLPWAVQGVLVFLAATLLEYVFHRLCHRVTLMWRFHRIHHASTRLTLFKTFINHPLDTSTWLVIPILVGLGARLDLTASIVMLQMMLARTAHANIDVEYGIFEWVFTSPRLHRIHHGRAMVDSQSNYGDKFIFWDRLLGTYRNREIAVDQQDLGIDGHVPRNPFTQIVHPFYKPLGEPTLEATHRAEATSARDELRDGRDGDGR